MWIVVNGNIIDGLEFLGPFETEDKALEYRSKVLQWIDNPVDCGFLCIAVELLKPIAHERAKIDESTH